jgi:hypothetical protein
LDQDHERQKPAQELETDHKDDFSNEDNLDDIDHDLEFQETGYEFVFLYLFMILL